MATIALSTAGTALFGPVGGFIGAAVGSYIDQEYIMPALFPVDPIQGPRIGELQLQGQDEGHPMNSCYAEFTRVGACIIWSSKLRETKTTDEVGGKGGGGEEVENYNYSVDLAIAFSDAPTAFSAIEKVYADVGLVFDFTPNVNFSSDVLSCTVIDIYEETVQVVDKKLTRLSVLTRKELKIASTTAGPDLGELRSGRDVVIAGWTETDYNLTARCNASWTNNDGSSKAKFELPTTASSAGEAAGNTITLDQTNPKFDTSKMDAVTIHLGGPSQPVDSFLEGVFGVGETPAFRDQCWAMVQNFQLKDYGNRVPQFQAELNRGTADDLEDVFNDILTDSDMLPAEFDVTALSGVTCRGYATRGPQPVLGRLQPLLVAFDILGQEKDGVITFIRRLNTVDIPVAVDDLTAQPEGARSGVAVPHEIDDADDTRAASEVLCKYVDIENDLQPGQQIERNPVTSSTYEKRTVEVTITFDGGEGRDLAAKVMWFGSSGQRTVAIQLPPSYATIQENDVLEYLYLGEPHRYRVNELNDGEDGVKQIVGQKEVTSHVTHLSPHDSPQGVGTAMYSPYDTTLSIIDIAPLTGAHVTVPVLYFAARSNQSTASWRGATLQQSSDGALTFQTVRSMPTQASMGRATSMLGVGTGCGQWDRGSTLVVEMNTGTLSTVTELECLNGANRAVIAGEIIGFTTVALSASQPDENEGISYDLTNLLRGLAGTELAMSDHNDGDRFVHLNAVGIETVDQNVSAVGATRDFVATSPGGDPLDFVPRTWIYGANNMRDFHPVLITSERGVPASNDWTVGWTRRSRAFFRVLSQVCPLVENVEDYEVDIYNAAETAILRVITSTASASGSVVTIPSTGPQMVYDEADQITDHGSAQATIHIEIFQTSSVLGHGKGTGIFTVS